MPKKHQWFHAKPASSAHPSLAPSESRQHGGSGVRGSSTTASVNDLISHLRRTQIPSPSPDDPPSSQRAQRAFITPRSVHPSLRGLLELPETLPPRPRPGGRRTLFGVRPSRRTVGPPPPASWLSRNDDAEKDQGFLSRVPGPLEQDIHRLNRLQRPLFPDRRSLLHLLLKSMALNWSWHIEFDGPFLSQLPNHIKELLLSYVAVYARGLSLDGYMKGLKPLFLTQEDQDQLSKDNPDFSESMGVNGDFQIAQLDLGNALGRWITLKQLTHEMIHSPAPALSRDTIEAVPSSWDEEIDEGKGKATPDDDLAPSVPMSITQTLRFPKLRALSLAHPKPSAASWPALLNLMAHLPTITHLSLAHWPIPHRNPSAAPERIREAMIKSSASDALEDHWAEAASVLRQLSRSTYCLKWLDLEGCAQWLPALSWVGDDPNGIPYSPDNVGPEWNGSWRDIEWLGIGPGFLDLAKSNSSLDLSFPETASQTLSADSLCAYHIQNARDVQRHIRQLRSGRKWIEIELGLGLEDIDTEIIRPPNGHEFSVYL
ncbi:hypothetical protein N7457_008725 [Penicillium paradoxum]|uniref:uncharacterized protein n=1 Tax=Penicillium paradoxum TaxID=176176 RepID=UPI0025483E51|nr:uncharacterized protein N7457_008725 [Penicillium paradoxum]KAJ5773829.1 hypothetical protein N7457_008725 [Penicillium paradoxum]